MRATERLGGWLLDGLPARGAHHTGPHAHRQAESDGHPWWQVLCLTGVDYFSSIGYQPAIAFLAVGVLSPIATCVLVLVTLFGALPVYRRVATESPRGEGSIAMLERILSWWGGKLFVLVLLGFAATDFVITMTLSAADAGQHLIENPYAPHWLHGHQLDVTLILLALLAAVFLRGFREAITIAVALVGVYLALNLTVVIAGIIQLAAHPAHLSDWWRLLTTQHSSWLAVIGVSLIGFPKLALGLSGFETGVLVMSQISGGEGSEAEQQARRVARTRRLLTVAALIMAGLLLSSSMITTMLIPASAFHDGGPANGRAMAYLAHGLLGDGFGTAYDASTILILWFAGASAMAGLLNLVPRYLPRYGMAPGWTRAVRPLVLIIALVAFAVTAIFDANVDDQAGAYATGVLVLISSAAIAVTLSAFRRRQRLATLGFALVTGVFLYTTAVNILKRPEGVIIGAIFIASIVAVSFVSRISRAYELRVPEVTLDSVARQLIDGLSRSGRLHLIANDPDARDRVEYVDKEAATRHAHSLELDQPVALIEVTVTDASEFETAITVHGEYRHEHRILTVQGSSVANALAALAIDVRDRTGIVPDLYFDWSELSPLHNQLRFLFAGVGEIAPVTREILRRAEPDTTRRPRTHVA